MEHMLLKAATTAQDQGVFEAVISSAAVDRELDVVSPAGLVNAFKRWVPSGKMVPLAWQHSSRAEDQIGFIDPSTARVVGSEVVASGWIDQSTERGKDAWRLVKNRTLGFSFGYLVPEGGSTERKGGGRNIDALDLFEVTATSVPMQHDTRVLGWKAANIDPQRQRAAVLEREANERTIPDMPPEPAPAPVPPSEPVSVPEARAQRRKAAELEREALAENRAREGQRLPHTAPEPEVEPESIIPPLPPETERQWKQAVATEREEKANARRREEARLPVVSLEPEPEPPEPEPRAVPSTRGQRRRAKQLEREQARTRRLREANVIPSLPDPEPEPEPLPEDPVTIPNARAQRRKAAAFEREQELERRRQEDPSLDLKMTKEPFSTSKTSNWVARGGGLPAYIQHIAHDLMDQRGMDESRAIQMAIGICQRWARGGSNVNADTRAKAAAAIAEWEALKAKSKGKAMGPMGDMADMMNVSEAPDTTDLEALVEQLDPEERTALFEALVSAAHTSQAQQTVGKALDDGSQRQRARRYERESEGYDMPDVPASEYATLRIPHSEMDGLAAGELKAVWSAAEINNLSDACFLYVESGGSKDQDGKTTPRSLRHFPYKDSSGNVDLPHLRNALSRIPQSNLPQDVKDRLTAKAQKILDGQSKSVDVTHDGHVPRDVDSLRKRAQAVALEHASGGESLRKPPREEKVAPKPQPELSLPELRQKARDEILIALSGVEDI